MLPTETVIQCIRETVERTRDIFPANYATAYIDGVRQTAYVMSYHEDEETKRQWAAFLAELQATPVNAVTNA